MTRGVAVPPIVTTGPVAAGPGVAGVLGQPGTVPLFGGRRMLNDWRAGLRAEAGVWFGDEQSWGAAARFYSLFSTSEQLVGGGNGTNVVNVPQFLTPGGAVVQVPVYVGFPGLTRGTVSTTAQTTFTGGDLSLRHALFTREHWRFEVVAGYRQLHLGDELGDQFTSSLTPLGLPATLIGEDSVRTRNNFYGGQLGTISTFSWDFWSLENTWAVALGNTASDVDFSRALLVSAGGLAPVPLVPRPAPSSGCS
jgi:hypothetical protein